MSKMTFFTLLFIIPSTVLLSSMQPEAKNVNFSTYALREIFRKSSHHVNTNKGNVVKQSGNCVEGCPSQVCLTQYAHARISALQCKLNNQITPFLINSFD